MNGLQDGLNVLLLAELHQPGDPKLEKLPADFSKFTAARSLRDVEPAVDLWIRNPDGFLVEGDLEDTQP